MDLEFNKEQQLLKSSVQDFLKKESPMTVVREMLSDEMGCSKKVWKKMAELGWLGIVAPDEYEGLEGNLIDLAIIMEEMGAACFTSPFFSTVISGIAVNEAGSEDQKKSILPKMVDGKLIMTLATDESEAWFGSPHISTTAAEDGDNYVINGTKLFVLNAHIADKIICLARTSDGEKPEDGLTFFIVDGKADGVTCHMLDTLANDKQNEVIFENVKVPKSSVLGEVGNAWDALEKVKQFASVAKSAESLGGLVSVLDMTAKYAKDRKQFGRPLGGFQVIAHYLADMMVDVDGSRVITYKAAWLLSKGLPAEKEVSMAKSFVSEASQRVTINGHQIHGAMGFCDEHDMHLYYRNATTTEMQFGDSDYHLEKVAVEIGL